MLNGSIYELAADPQVRAALSLMRPNPISVKQKKQEIVWANRAAKRKKTVSENKRDILFQKNEFIRKRSARNFKMIYAAIREEIEATGMSVRLARSPYRPAYMCEARDRLIWTARMKTELSFIELGKFFHRDHASIMNSIKNHERRLATGEQLNTLTTKQHVKT